MKTVIVDGKVYKLFDNLYLVAEDSSVLRKLEPYVCKTRPDGYCTAGSKRLVHRMVAMCWIPNPNGFTHIHHKDGDKTNNHVSNLEWLTPKAHISGKHPRPTGIYNMSEAGKQSLRKYRTGRKHSPETIAKITEASHNHKGAPRGWKKGMTHTPETLIKLSENAGKTRPCCIDGIQYKSLKQAGDALNIRSLTIRKRCLSKNFSNYSFPFG